MKDLTNTELEERYKQNDKLEARHQETKYPASCKGCPNNPDSYIELNHKYIDEMGGKDE